MPHPKTAKCRWVMAYARQLQERQCLRRIAKGWDRRLLHCQW